MLALSREDKWTRVSDREKQSVASSCRVQLGKERRDREWDHAYESCV